LLFVTGGADLKNSIDKRIEELEKRFRRSEVTLIMSDGSHVPLHLGRGKDGADLFARTMASPDSPTADLIRRSVGALEPGGSRFIELCRALLNSPGESDAEDYTDFRRETEKEHHHVH
jgi:hypothetical protein